MDIIPFHPPNECDAQNKKSELVMKILLGLVDAGLRPEPTRQATRVYIAALMRFPAELLARAVVEGLQRWTFYPSLAEILQVVHECQFNPQAYAQAYDKLRKRYEQAYAEGKQPKSLPSVWDEAPTGLVPVAYIRDIQSELTRGQLIGMGLEEPSLVDVPSRLAELRRQAEQLQTAEQKRKDIELQFETGVLVGLS